MTEKATVQDYAEIGRSLAEIVPEVSFMIFNDPDFRQFVKFDTLAETEQDRIFNELEVSFLGLFILYLEELSDKTKEFPELASADEMKKALIAGFLSIFEMLGIGPELVATWKKLIDLRVEEYQTDYKFLLKETATMPEFKEDKENIALRWARTETITLDCVEHIRRGKLEAKDPLIKFIRLWTIAIEARFSKGIKKAIFRPKAES